MIRLLIFCLLLALIHTAYIPQFSFATSDTFFNKVLSSYGNKISDLLNNSTIANQTNKTVEVEGVKITVNLTNITQNVSINWQANVINVTNSYNFTTFSKNINITLHSYIDFKIGLTKKQSGNLTILITKLDTNTSMYFKAATCAKGAGFDLQIYSVECDPEIISINITHKTIDNRVIKAVISILRNRIPTIINDLALNKINPLITNVTCNSFGILENVGDQQYIIQLNTTSVPKFTNHELNAPIDLTITNFVTTATNNQIEDQNLPADHLYQDSTNFTLTASSNLINTILWLIQDSHLLKQTIYSVGNFSISLNTTDLSIILPGLMKWPGRQVILMLQPANKFSQLFIRSGRLLTAISLSLKFIVNDDDSSTDNITKCLNQNHCFIATNLNITLTLSVSTKLNTPNYIQGLIQSIKIYTIQPIQSKIDVNSKTLLVILNSLISSNLPQINKQLYDGIDITEQLAKYTYNKVRGLKARTFIDYICAGLIIDL